MLNFIILNIIYKSKCEKDIVYPIKNYKLKY